MNENKINSICKTEADRIREKLKASRLYGEPLDIENTDAVIYSAYLMGKNEELERNLHKKEIGRMLREA